MIYIPFISHWYPFICHRTMPRTGHLQPPGAAFPPTTRHQRPAPREASAPGDAKTRRKTMGKTSGKPLENHGKPMENGDFMWFYVIFVWFWWFSIGIGSFWGERSGNIPFWKDLIWWIYESSRQNALTRGHLIWLVVSTPLKNMKVNWDDYSQYMGK